MSDNQQPDWPPRASAFGLPEGEQRRGSTGQLWEVKSGQWIRVQDTPPQPASDDVAGALMKRPAAFRVRRADPSGDGLSTTEWRYFEDERAAQQEASDKGTDYQGLYVRDGGSAPPQAAEASTAYDSDLGKITEQDREYASEIGEEEIARVLAVAYGVDPDATNATPVRMRHGSPKNATHVETVTSAPFWTDYLRPARAIVALIRTKRGG